MKETIWGFILLNLRVLDHLYDSSTLQLWSLQPICPHAMRISIDRLSSRPGCQDTCCRCQYHRGMCRSLPRSSCWEQRWTDDGKIKTLKLNRALTDPRKYKWCLLSHWPRVTDECEHTLFRNKRLITLQILMLNEYNLNSKQASNDLKILNDDDSFLLETFQLSTCRPSSQQLTVTLIYCTRTVGLNRWGAVCSK